MSERNSGLSSACRAELKKILDPLYPSTATLDRLEKIVLHAIDDATNEFGDRLTRGYNRSTRENALLIGKLENELQRLQQSVDLKANESSKKGGTIHELELRLKKLNKSGPTIKSLESRIHELHERHRRDLTQIQQLNQEKANLTAKLQKQQKKPEEGQKGGKMTNEQLRIGIDMQKKVIELNEQIAILEASHLADVQKIKQLIDGHGPTVETEVTQKLREQIKMLEIRHEGDIEQIQTSILELRSLKGRILELQQRLDSAQGLRVLCEKNAKLVSEKEDEITWLRKLLEEREQMLNQYGLEQKADAFLDQLSSEIGGRFAQEKAEQGASNQMVVEIASTEAAGKDQQMSNNEDVVG